MESVPVLQLGVGTMVMPRLHTAARLETPGPDFVDASTSEQIIPGKTWQLPTSYGKNESAHIVLTGLQASDSVGRINALIPHEQ